MSNPSTLILSTEGACAIEVALCTTDVADSADVANEIEDRVGEEGWEGPGREDTTIGMLSVGEDMSGSNMKVSGKR
jgi:hypothetical protein